MGEDYSINRKIPIHMITILKAEHSYKILVHFTFDGRYSLEQCSRGLALHTARVLKNGGALRIFNANLLTFDGFKI